MIWFYCLFSTFAILKDSPPKVADDFFTQAVGLHDEAWKLEDPVIVRKYTVLLSEFYAQQYLFRAFAMRDLRGNEALWLLRKNASENVQNDSQGMVENNLEELLSLANKKFGKDLNIRFAIAQFLYRGRDFLPSPRLKMTPKETLEIFREARKKQIFSGASLYVLALKDFPRHQKSKEVYETLKLAHQLNPFDPDIMSALSTHALSLDHWSVGARTARKLFDIAPNPEFKTEALVNIARVFYHKKNYEQALKAINTCLEIQPRHPFAWNIGLDILRTQKKSSEYQDLINQFLNTDINNPSIFRAYLDYLKVRGTHKFDQTFLSYYAKTEFPTPLARMTQQTNLGNLHIQNGEFKTAANYYQKARAIFKDVPNAPPQIAAMLDELIETATKKSGK